MSLEDEPSILVDTIPIVPGRTSTGVKVYLVDLLREIPERDRSRITLLTTQSNADVFETIDGFNTIRVPWDTEARPLRVVTQQVAVPIIAGCFQPDVLFEPVDTAAVLAPVPIVTSMHSSHINMKGHQMGGLRSMYNQLFLRLTARRSSKLIAISKFVKRSLSDVLDIPLSRIETVYHGGGLVEEALSRGWSPDESERTGGIFFISTLYPHKNADQLIRAYARLRRRRSDMPRLTIAGGDTDGETPTEENGTERERLNALAAKLGVGDHVHFPGRISDDALLDYLASEQLMVFPSSLEGFGIPALEAMQAGLPLVASNQSSVPEIVGEGGITVDPDDIEAMADKIEAALFDEELREQLVQAGLDRGRHFSWEQTARCTLRVLDSAGG
jgi:glycosyltransferase involved in cell wall biosynthesis